MQVQVSTDNHINGGEELTRQVEAVVEGALGRFSDGITRVEVQLSDESSGSKTRDNDKRASWRPAPPVSSRSALVIRGRLWIRL